MIKTLRILISLFIVIIEQNLVDCGANFTVSTYKSNVTSITGWGTGKPFGDRMKAYIDSFL